MNKYKCPICNAPFPKYKYTYYTEEWGIVEQHGCCSNCGYHVEQAYSDTIEFFLDIRKGSKVNGKYFSKNIKKHKRIRRKMNKYKGIPVNPIYAYYM